MSSLQLDIRTNDEFAKSAYKAADALDVVAAKEKQVNALANKIGQSYKATASYAKDLSPGAASKLNPTSSKALDAEKKAVALKTKEAKAAKDQNKGLKEAIGMVSGVGAALAGAATAAAALGAALAVSAKHAFDTKKESAGLIDAFTGKRGAEHVKLLDTLAVNLGASIDDVRSKFVEFRQAGLDNKLSFALIKMRADLMAVGLSAAQADKEVARVTGAADGRENIAARMALDEISRAYRGIGDGAKAAAYNAANFEGAQNKLSNAFGEALADVWKEIGPSIGKAAHELADFAVDLLKSKEGKEMIAGVTDAFKALAGVVTGDNLKAGLHAIAFVGGVLGTVFNAWGIAIGFVASKAVELGSAFIDMNKKILAPLYDAVKEVLPLGAALVDGLVKGIVGAAGKAVDAITGVAKDVASSFAAALGIKSPSKVFEEYGKNTVAGFQVGEEKAIGAASMPLQSAAAQPIPPSANTGSAGASITIENIIVQGGGNAEEIARSIRAQLQRMLQDMSLSRGFA